MKTIKNLNKMDANEIKELRATIRYYRTFANHIENKEAIIKLAEERLIKLLSEPKVKKENENDIASDIVCTAMA